jgi:outer membrane protein OmpA-like peptidoglycan-associated protein
MKKLVIILFILFSHFVFAIAESNDGSTISVVPQLGGSVVIPVGVFKEIAPVGAGVEFDLGVSDLIFKNSALKLCVGYNFISEELEVINSFGMISLTLLGGYTIAVTDGFSITPLAGGGYLGHAVDADEQLWFFDPQVSLQTEFDLLLGENFFVSLMPGFTLFFEQNDNMGSFFSMNLGVKKAFDIGSGGERPLVLEPVSGLPRIIIERDLPIFSPNGDGYKDLVVLTIKVDGDLPAKSYTLNIVDKKDKPVRVFSEESSLGQRLEWNGRDNKNKPVVDAEYRAILTVRYADGRSTTAESDSFILDTIPPKASLLIAPKPFSPDNDGENDQLSISCQVQELNGVRDWKIRIDDQQGQTFKTFAGRGDVPKEILWDGKSADGKLVESAEDYSLTLELSDEAGNRTMVKDMISTDILVRKYGDQAKIVISNIQFEAYSSDFQKGDKTIVKENLAIIDRLAEILKKYGTYKIVIEGHALNLYWNDKTRAAKEEELLITLSKERAENIKQALVERGIDSGRISTQGKGSAEPLVPLKDKNNQWKNRRVEIILEKK